MFAVPNRGGPWFSVPLIPTDSFGSIRAELENGFLAVLVLSHGCGCGLGNIVPDPFAQGKWLYCKPRVIVSTLSFGSSGTICGILSVAGNMG